MSTDPSSQPTKPQLTKPQPSAPATQAAATQAPHSLCVLRLTALGDCINAFGLLGALKRTYPELELSWIIDARFAPNTGPRATEAGLTIPPNAAS